MEKKKENITKKKIETKKKLIKKEKSNKIVSNKKKAKKESSAFTLIELLAVIIILGVLMIIAIPSVTTYISDSRKNSYIDTAKNIVGGARNIANEGKLGMYDTDTTYYLRASCINTENGLKSPYGDFTEAYVGVTFDGKGYNYYWISTDSSGQGVKDVTPVDKLDIDKIEANLTDTEIKEKVDKTGVDGRSKIQIINDNCNSWGSPLIASTQVGSDGDLIVEPISFSTDSWSTIRYAVKNNKTDVYNIGDKRMIDMGSFGIHEVRLANITKCQSNDMSESSCGFIVEFTEFVTLKNMDSRLSNSNSNPGGWTNSELRSFLNNDIYNSLPNDLKIVIIDTKVISGHCRGVDNNLVSNDKLYLFSEKELGINSSLDSSKDNTRTVDYYIAHNSTADRYKKVSDNDYWVRTCASNSLNNEFGIIYSGWDYTRPAGNTYGVTPSFRIG